MGRRSVVCWGCVVLAALVPALFGSTVTAGERLPRTLVLSDGWRFQPDPLGIGDAQQWQRPDHDRSAWRAARVPMAWDEYDPAMDGYEGTCGYALSLPAERIAAGAWQRLRFARANHHATVWIDGQKVADDSLGYLPFEVPATPRLAPDDPCDCAGDDARVTVAAEPQNTAGVAFTGRVRLEVEGVKAEAPARLGAGRSGIVTLELVLPRPACGAPTRRRCTRRTCGSTSARAESTPCPTDSASAPSRPGAGRSS